MATVSVVIPTHDRPDLLREALRSVAEQSLRPDEVIVVDDGSTPAVDESRLKESFGPTVRVIRNEEARGLAFARNLGVEGASGEMVVHLDDDDLLAPNALLEGHALFLQDARLEIAFLGVQGFGPRATHFNEAQSNALARVLSLARPTQSSPGAVYFDSGLMIGLLRTVPMAFQRVMLRRSTWQVISRLRWQAYRLNADVPDDTTAKLRITGPLRDSEWALYAAAVCHRTAMISRPLYLQRCEGQGYSSQPANIAWHIDQSLLIKTQLLHATRELAELRRWIEPVKASLASAQFDAAHHYFLAGKRIKTWRHLCRAIALRPNFSNIRFAFRMWLPRRVSS